MANYCNNILETIGNTPVVKVNRLAPPGIDLFVKLESFNPMGSVKDRMALSVIQQAEREGKLKPGQTVVEATSGNTGIGLAMVCAATGYPLVLTMAESFSVERRKILRFLGAQVVLTPAELKGSGMLGKAVELAQKHGWFLVRKFENEANADLHTRTTALEILDVFRARQLDYFVTGYGTGGTLKGTARMLRERSPHTRIVVCEPDNSPLLGSGIPQAHAPDGSPAGSHPSFRPHLMQGWTPDFIPRLAEDAVAMQLIDQVVPINGQHAIDMARRLARREGIFCGTSGYRFDVPAVAAPAAAGPAAATQTPVAAGTAPAAAFVDAAIHDPDSPVLMFALEWCEFCWAVRKLFGELGIACKSIDLDSVDYQENDWGGQIRDALRARLGSGTIPQVFVAGAHLGGATDTFEAFRRGDLQARLDQAGIAHGDLGNRDPFELLPNWLHKS